MIDGWTFELAQQWSRTDVRSYCPQRRHCTARNRRGGGRVGRMPSFRATMSGSPLFSRARWRSSTGTRKRHCHATGLGGAFDGQPLRPGTGCRSVSLLAMIEDENAICVMSVLRAVFDRIGIDATRSTQDYEFGVGGARRFRHREPEATACIAGLTASRPTRWDS